MMNAEAEHPSSIRVMIVDDHKSIVWGLERLIESAYPTMTIAATANSCDEMLAKLATAKPDVILLDIDLDGVNAVSALHEIQHQSPARVLMLTGGKDLAIQQDAFIKGAHGVIGKDEEAETLLRAIECVHYGEVWINRAMMGQVLSAVSATSQAGVIQSAVAVPTATTGSAGKRDPAAVRIASLTQREREIVTAIVKNRGAKSQTIAETVCISEHTLRNHLTIIYSKLDVRNRLDLYAYAMEHGLVRD